MTTHDCGQAGISKTASAIDHIACIAVDDELMTRLGGRKVIVDLRSIAELTKYAVRTGLSSIE